MKERREKDSIGEKGMVLQGEASEGSSVQGREGYFLKILEKLFIVNLGCISMTHFLPYILKI